MGDGVRAERSSDKVVRGVDAAACVLAFTTQGNVNMKCTLFFILLPKLNHLLKKSGNTRQGGKKAFIMKLSFTIN